MREGTKTVHVAFGFRSLLAVTAGRKGREESEKAPRKKEKHTLSKKIYISNITIHTHSFIYSKTPEKRPQGRPYASQTTHFFP